MRRLLAAAKSFWDWLYPLPPYTTVPVRYMPVSKVSPGDPMSYVRAAHDCLALAEEARDSFCEYKAQLTEQYLNSRVKRTPAQARHLALQHPLVRQAIEDERMYDRWAKRYAQMARVERESSELAGS